MKVLPSILALFIFWSCTQSTESDFTSDLEASKTLGNMVYTLTINKNIFKLTDSLKIKFEVKNVSTFPKTYNFANVQQFWFKLIDESENIALFYPWIVSPATSAFTILPGQSKIFSNSSLFKDQNGNFINKGFYHLLAYLMNENSPEVGLRIWVQ